MFHRVPQNPGLRGSLPLTAPPRLDGVVMLRHVTLHSLCTWLHGDPRGFRSRDHRIHSSGDYKSPPPQGEHAGLWTYHLNRSQPAVQFLEDIRAPIGQVLVRYLLDEGHRILIVSVSKTHAHLLVELPNNEKAMKEIIGRAKSRSSRAVKDQLPGSIWAEGGDFEPVLNAAHESNAFSYIRDQQGPDAWTWTHLDALPPELPPNRAPRKKKR